MHAEGVSRSVIGLCVRVCEGMVMGSADVAHLFFVKGNKFISQ